MLLSQAADSQWSRQRWINRGREDAQRLRLHCFYTICIPAMQSNSRDVISLKPFQLISILYIVNEAEGNQCGAPLKTTEEDKD